MRCTKEEEEYESGFGARFGLTELAGGKGVVEVGTISVASVRRKEVQGIGNSSPELLRRRR